MSASRRQVRIVTDSAADIPADLARELDITVIPLNVIMEGKTYRDGVDLSGEEFYERLKTTRSVTTTSLPSLDAFAEAYRRLTTEGCDVVSIHLSSKLSGTFNAALMASTADGVSPEAIEVVDSRSVSMAQGWIAIRAVEAARSGGSLAEVDELAENLAKRTALYGVLNTLEYVIRSGRVSRLPGTVGNFLSIKPIVTTLPNGEATILEKVRTRKKALTRVVQLTSELGPLERIAVMHGADEEGATQLADMLQSLDVPQPIMICHIGAVLGTHLGPEAVGVCCLKSDG
ncbi:MAG TPA: DegV family protein [Chloroflexia bacterium]|nr:DegV family protein [Chloroflexia bacterium]